VRSGDSVKDGFLHHASFLEVFDHNALEQLWRDGTVPDSFRVYDDDRAAFADSQTGSLASLDACGTKEQPLSLQ